MPQSFQSRLGYHNTPSGRQPFHRSHTSLGATGHWVKTLGILSPLVIGEFVHDPEQKWRAVRISAIATALVSEALWAHKIAKEREARQAREEQRQQ